MNNLTNEERARIFAMYMPCEVIISNNVVCTAIGVSHIGKGNILVPTKGDVDDYAEAPLSMTQLLLTPLSKITDEHAIEVAKIWKPDYKWDVIGRDQFDCLLMVECSDYIMWFDFMDSSFSFEEKYTGEENIEAHRCEKEETSCESIVEILDRLRELGYALPYKGKSLFELGVAIEKLND